MDFRMTLITSTSITVEIINQNPYYANDNYQVYLNSELRLEGKKNIFSLYNLIPNNEYTLKVIDNSGENVHIFKTLVEFIKLNVRKFGAKGDGVKDDTLALQTAIYACPDNGRVFIPKGIYYTKPLFLRSNITIELAKDAKLLGSPKREDYPILPGVSRLSDESDDYILGTWEGNPLDIFASIITGINVSNVKIIGEGIIDANAQNGDWWINHKIRRGAFRPRGVFLNKCKQITLQGVTVCNTPSWNLHPFFSEDIAFIDLKIISPKDSPNTDGCDPESCKNVDIIGVDFSVGDDCIAIKSGKIYMGSKYKKPSENFNIRNCIMKYGHGAVVMGSEISGGVKNINVSNCLFMQTDRGLRIKTRRGRGKDSIVDNIHFENIYMDNVLTPLVMNMYYFCDPDGKTEYVYSKEKHTVDERTPAIKNISFKNIVAKDCEYSAGVFWGLPESPIQSITIENMEISYKLDSRKGDPAMLSFVEPVSKQGLLFNYVENVTLSNVNLDGYVGEEICLNNVASYKNNKELKK